MYGLVFYLNKAELKKAYGEEKNYHDAYEEIRDVLRHYGFHWLSNSFYFSRSINSMTQIFLATRHLKKIDFFTSSLVSLHVFRMSDLSNFTEYIIEDHNPKKMDEEEFDVDIEKGKTKKRGKK
ncbi:virulence-associated protein VapD [Metamycoplasma subdolum]|uniref:Virulence-associated protein VapD n=1 Tax=Metamycoplasma subdolum TaxID=92407 RepID=A0A3M0A1K3_9BACT|nr:virulence protein [Metamycoplasma subdolum]RMA78517.1 virulence-associated protein VapD [Metamycoplasma subdolum]WPB50449.1 virulence protein [Metamycoplasma subdolum]